MACCQTGAQATRLRQSSHSLRRSQRTPGLCPALGGSLSIWTTRQWKSQTSRMGFWVEMLKLGSFESRKQTQTGQPWVREDPRNTMMDAGRRDQTLLRLQDPFRVEIVLRIIPGVVQISHIRALVAATPAARPDDRRRTHTAICIHRVAMMSPMRGQSDRSRESEDSKTDKNAFCHSQLL